MRKRLALVLVALGCGSQGVAPGGGADAGLAGRCRQADGGTPLFGLNDVSILVPLPLNEVPVLLRAGDLGASGQPLITRSLYDALVYSPSLGEDMIFEAYDRLQVVGVRFDLCDRVEAGPCKHLEPVLRVVFQPVAGAEAADIAFHAFYRIPQAERDGLLEQLGQLAALQALPTSSALQVSPELKREPNGAYARSLRALLTRFCGASTLRRLTFFAQPDSLAAIRWEMRGLEMTEKGPVQLTIPNTASGTQVIQLLGDDVVPSDSADVPSGFSRATRRSEFEAATSSQRLLSLGALVEVDNPLLRNTDTLQCVTCHASTFLTTDRSARAELNATQVGGRYRAASFDLGVGAGISSSTQASMRAFGWFFDQPAISQRVVNESAQVLVELGQCSAQ